MWEKHTTDTGQSFGKDLGAAHSRLGSAHDVMPRVVVVVIVIVVVVVQIPASREAEFSVERDLRSGGGGGGLL